MLLLRGRSQFCKGADPGQTTSTTSNHGKRGHASIEASLEQPLEFINDELINTTPKQAHLRRRPIGGERKRASCAA